jgi:NAD(P)H dehydrogenase (quinone)
MPPRIFVTGATGTVGGAVVGELMKQGHDIELVAASRSKAGAEKLRARGITSACFDYELSHTLQPALEGVDAIFLATGYHVDMLVHSKKLLDAAKAQNVKHIVHLGALAPDDTPFAHFSWHQMIEHSIEAMGFSWTHLRPNFFMDTVWQGLKYRPDRIVHFVGDAKVSWISAEDIGAVAAVALCDATSHAGKIYPLAVESLGFDELAAILTRETGNKVEYLPRSSDDLLPILLKQGMEQTYAQSLALGLAAVESGGMPLSNAIYDNVKNVTGRQPVTWKDFAKNHLDELSA